MLPAGASSDKCPFVIIAHRGDSSAAPENTTEAFDLALARGFPHIETDCQLSADGVPVVLHDEQLGRVNNGSGPVAAASLATLQALDAGSWFGPQFAGARIPTLQRVLERYRGKVHLHLELKSQQQALPAAVAAVIQHMRWLPQQLQADAVAAAAGAAQPAAQGTAQASCGVAGGATMPMQQQLAVAEASRHSGSGLDKAGPIGIVPGLTITSFHLQQLQASQQLLPTVPHGWLVQEVTADIISTAQQGSFEMVCPRANALTPEAVQQLRQHGFAVRAWGVKSMELLHHVVACGADGATVNWPQEAAQELIKQTTAG